jgi:hypothetical protein
MTRRPVAAGLLTLASDAGAISSRTDARLDGIRCIQACNNDFNDYTQASASCRQPADCPIPTLRERTGAH